MVAITIDIASVFLGFAIGCFFTLFICWIVD